MSLSEPTPLEAYKNNREEKRLNIDLQWQQQLSQVYIFMIQILQNIFLDKIIHTKNENKTLNAWQVNGRAKSKRNGWSLNIQMRWRKEQLILKISPANNNTMIIIISII